MDGNTRWQGGSGTSTQGLRPRAHSVDIVLAEVTQTKNIKQQKRTDKGPTSGRAVEIRLRSVVCSILTPGACSPNFKTPKLKTSQVVLAASPLPLP